jgi:hypothetical protein
MNIDDILDDRYTGKNKIVMLDGNVGDTKQVDWAVLFTDEFSQVGEHENVSTPPIVSSFIPRIPGTVRGYCAQTKVTRSQLLAQDDIDYFLLHG